MRLTRECYQMQQVIETHLPHLSRQGNRVLMLDLAGHQSGASERGIRAGHQSGASEIGE